MWTYVVNWGDYGASGSAGFLTTEPFPPGTNVYTFIALSQHNVRDESIAGGFGSAAWALIYGWTHYTQSGEASELVIFDPWYPSAFLDNCNSITYALYARGAFATATASVFIR